MRRIPLLLLAGALALESLAACGGFSLPFVRRAPLELWAFAEPAEPRSARSAERNGARLDALIAGAFVLDTAVGALRATPADTLVAARRMSVVTTRQRDGAHPEVVRALAADPARLAGVAGGLASAAQARGLRGLVLDLEGHDASDLTVLLAVTSAIADSARARGIDTVVMVVPAGDTLAYPARPFLRAADLILVTLYGEHWAGSAPGPIASPDWVRRHLDQRIAEVGADRLVAALPLFGYQWWGDSATILVSHDDAQRLALAAGVGIAREPASRTLRALRPGAWEMWVSDAELLRDLIAGVRETGVRRIALWRLGLEDEEVWGVVGARH